MARDANASPGRQRLIEVATVAALAVATALAFGRVFRGRAPTLELVAVAVASVAVAAAVERRGLLLATAASALALLWTIALIVFPRTLWYGLPSRETLEAIRHALALVGEQAKVQVAPTEPLAPLMLAAVTALWTAAFSAHALALRAGSPILATLPPVALVGFADTVLEDGARPIYAIVFLSAALAVVFVDGLRRIRQWGPIWAEGRRAARVRTEGARSVALVALATAVLMPGLLPGFRSGPLVDFATTGEGGPHLDPFVSIHNQLTQGAEIPLFRVRASEASYWRVEALDVFDGTGWSPSDPTLEKGQPLPGHTTIPTDVPADAPTLEQTFEFLADDPDPLPMAYPPESLDAPVDQVRYAAGVGAVLVPGGVDAGFRYTVTSRPELPTVDQLDAVAFEPRSAYGLDTYVPPSIDPHVLELAQRWTLGATTPYERIYAIQEHFLDPTNGFVYDEHVRPSADAGALLEFLTGSRRGFCQQYAAAMATMVRLLGYPARVAVGYRPGEPSEGAFTVTTHDAHAWVEVEFPGYGWLRFDPTPRSPRPLEPAGTYLNPNSATGPGQTDEGGHTTKPGDAQPPDCTGGAAGQRQLCNGDPVVGKHPERHGRGGSGRLPPLQAEDRVGYHIPYRPALLVLLGVLFLLAVAIPPAKAIRRRLALRRARDPRERVLATFLVFDAQAADLGLGRERSETFEEYRDRVAATVTLSDGHLSRLVATTARAAYAPSDPTEEDAAAATSAARSTLDDLRREVGLARRLVGTYRPGR